MSPSRLRRDAPFPAEENTGGGRSLRAEASVRSVQVYILFIMCAFWNRGDVICLNGKMIF